jgi:putative phosphoesterase
MKIGIISDTHGLLRPEAVAALQGSNFIIHAGDIGAPEILDRLGDVAPVTAVRGNVDRESWAKQLPETNLLDAGGFTFYVLHDIQQLDVKPEAARFAAVIFGHSHSPDQQTKNGVLYFNPGSAGPRRFHLPVSVGQIIVSRGRVKAEIIELDV